MLDLKLTSHNFFKFFEKRLRQFFGRAGNQAAAELGDFATGFRFCAIMQNCGLTIFGQSDLGDKLGIGFAFKSFASRNTGLEDCDID